MCFVSDILGVYNVLINVFCKWYIWGLQNVLMKCVLKVIYLGLQCINKCVLKVIY